MDYNLHLSNYSYSKEKEIHYYITAEIILKSADWPFTIFTLGDGSRYGAYVNAALEKGKTYKVYVRAISRTKAVWKLFLSLYQLCIVLLSVALDFRKASFSSFLPVLWICVTGNGLKGLPSVAHILHYNTIWHTIPYHTILYHTIPYHTISYHTIPYHTIPYHTIPYHTILFIYTR